MLQKMQMLRGLAVSSALATIVVLSGCGNSNTSTTTNNAPVALAELGQADFIGLSPNRGGGSAGAGTLNNPRGSVATNGTLFYIADYANNRVLGYKSIPVNNGAAADFVIGQPDLVSSQPNQGLPTAGTATNLGLAHPSKVAISGTKLVITDSGNNRVLIWNTLPNPAGASFTTPPDVVVGQADKVSRASATTATGLSNPNGALIAAGKLFVADTTNNRVLIFNTVPATSGVAADVVLGQPGFTTSFVNCSTVNNACTASNTFPAVDSLSSPVDVWSDGVNTLLVSDNNNNRVLYWSQVPSVNQSSASFVIGQQTFSTNNFGSGSQGLNKPYGIWSDLGHIFVADLNNNRVLQFNGSQAANGAVAQRVFGQGDAVHVTANDDDQNSSTDVNTSNLPVATARTLNGPLGVYTLPGTPSKLYITDSSNSRITTYTY
jgi:hypothetical protein